MYIDVCRPISTLMSEASNSTVMMAIRYKIVFQLVVLGASQFEVFNFIGQSDSIWETI